MACLMGRGGPRQNWLFTPELQWQPRGKRRISQGWLFAAYPSEDEDTSEEDMRYEWQCFTHPDGGPCIDHSNASKLEAAAADEEDDILPPVRARQKYSIVVLCVYDLCIYYTFGMPPVRARH
jgi:hypothetical protein